MVFLTFPNALTDEEEMLKQKYAKLRKKKKQLLSLKATKPEIQQKPVDQITKKAPESAGEATEQAKKLVQSGAIKVGSGCKEKSGFKRSKHMEKKKETDRQSSYKPFMSSHSVEEDDRLEGSKPKLSRLNDTFVPSSTNATYEEAKEVRRRSGLEGDGGRYDHARDRDNRRGSREDYRDREPPAKGNTVYVHGIGITEEILKTAFSNFGNIVHINIEHESTGFVTFEKMESADQAIAAMNGSMVSNVQLKVSMAFKQPSFDNILCASSATWSTIGVNLNPDPLVGTTNPASNSQKGSSKKDDREAVSYEDMF